MSSSKIIIYNIQANFYEDKSSIGDMSPYLLFDGDFQADGKADKHGRHSGKTDVAKKAGAGPVQWDDRVELHLQGSTILVQGKAKSSLMPDKVVGEGQVNVGGGGRQTVQLTDPKTGNVAGEASFEIDSSGSGIGGGIGGVGTGGRQGYSTGGQQGYNTNQGYDNGGGGLTGGNTGGITGGQSGYGTGGQGAGTQGYGTGSRQTGTGYDQGAGNQSYGTGGTGGQQTGIGYDQGTSNQGYSGSQGGIVSGGGGASGGTGAGFGAGTGAGQQQGGEHYEKKTHNVADHNEDESYETRDTRR